MSGAVLALIVWLQPHWIIPTNCQKSQRLRFNVINILNESITQTLYYENWEYLLLTITNSNWGKFNIHCKTSASDILDNYDSWRLRETEMVLVILFSSSVTAAEQWAQYSIDCITAVLCSSRSRYCRNFLSKQNNKKVATQTDPRSSLKVSH